uniref:pre-mycofactocin synthase MftD n=1 Tax=Nocardia brasiliensis TaxID=37326 RepID=UPI0024553213
MNPWFETVAEAQRRAKKRLPKSVYGALIAGSERGQTIEDNQRAFTELGFAPHVAGPIGTRDQSTTVLGQQLSMPVMISPTGVQAVHPDGEVAVARAAAARGIAMGLSSFASKPIEEVIAANPATFFQLYWCGGKDEIVQRMARAKAAGAVGLILTLDWSFSHGRDWGSPVIPEKLDLRTMLKFAPQTLARPRWLATYLKSGHIPDLTAPNMAIGDAAAPGFFGAYGEWMGTPPPDWADVRWICEQWDGPVMLKGVIRVDDALRAVGARGGARAGGDQRGQNQHRPPPARRARPAGAPPGGGGIEGGGG